MISVPARAAFSLLAMRGSGESAKSVCQMLWSRLKYLDGYWMNWQKTLRSVTVCRCSGLPTLQILLRVSFFTHHRRPLFPLHSTFLQENYAINSVQCRKTVCDTQSFLVEDPQMRLLGLVSCCFDVWSLA